MPHKGKSMLNTSNQFNNNYSKKIEFDPDFKFLMNIQKKTRIAHNNLNTYLSSRVSDTQSVSNNNMIQFKIS
tara:strand:- start:1307 stop:1522 length:216 start_codon:yes stop_codon:yes gene_type:complete